MAFDGLYTLIGALTVGISGKVTMTWVLSRIITPWSLKRTTWGVECGSSDRTSQLLEMVSSYVLRQPWCQYRTTALTNKPTTCKACAFYWGSMSAYDRCVRLAERLQCIHLPTPSNVAWSYGGWGVLVSEGVGWRCIHSLHLPPSRLGYRSPLFLLVLLLREGRASSLWLANRL
ncbi:hypothetical protein BDQ17DRAFT_460973 [Cyathus striatus]|nr:hypothetical protein BDQ17DRAFT_460973 [Cyathus striatus]